MSEFHDLLMEYFSDASNSLAAKEFGPVTSITQYFQSEDSWKVVCYYPGDNRVEASVNCGELMGWMWARIRPMIKSTS